MEDIYNEILPFADKGKQADYIPALAKVDPDQFGMCLKTIAGDEYAGGYPFLDTEYREGIRTCNGIVIKRGVIMGQGR